MRSVTVPVEVKSSHSSHEVHVLEAHRPPCPHLGYIDQVVGSGDNGIRFSYFSGVLQRFDADIVHIHHPAALLGNALGGGGSWGEDFALTMAARVVLKKLRRNRMLLVQTVHARSLDQRPHWQRIIDEATSQFITVNETTATPDPKRTTMIPHAHFRERFLGFPQSEQIPGRLLYIAPGASGDSAFRLLRIFPLASTELTLRLTGQSAVALAAQVRASAEQTAGRVTGCFGHLSDARMIQEITAAELVLLPAVRSLREEELLFLCLSLGRPVVMPSSPAVELLRDEVGPGWIYPYRETLTAERLDKMVAQSRLDESSAPPHLEGRDMRSTAARYATVFRGAVSET